MNLPVPWRHIIKRPPRWPRLVLVLGFRSRRAEEHHLGKGKCLKVKVKLRGISVFTSFTSQGCEARAFQFGFKRGYTNKYPRFFWCIYGVDYLVGGWTNPFENMHVKKGSSSPFFGVKIPKYVRHATTKLPEILPLSIYLDLPGWVPNDLRSVNYITIP